MKETKGEIEEKTKAICELSDTKTCPHCGGKLEGTVNPSKLACTLCGRIIPNFSYLSRFRRMKLKEMRKWVKEEENYLLSVEKG